MLKGMLGNARLTHFKYREVCGLVNHAVKEGIHKPSHHGPSRDWTSYLFWFLYSM
jgi:hypothetical protein